MRDGAPAEHAFTSALALNLVLRSRADSLLLKTVHDAYNSEGIVVRNALSQEWRTFGDANLGGHAETTALAALASKASRDAVQDVLATGGTTRAEAALDYIPDVAQLGGGLWARIEDFSKDPSVWQPGFLERSLSGDPAVNPLYNMVKGKFGADGRAQSTPGRPCRRGHRQGRRLGTGGTVFPPA